MDHTPKFCTSYKPEVSPEEELYLQIINAIYANDPVKMRQLLAQGVDPYALEQFRYIDPAGRPSTEMARYAIKLGNCECLQVLLENGLTPNYNYSYYHVDWFLLEIAVDENRLDCFKTLLTAGANVNVGSSDSPGVFELALKSPNDEFLRLLISAGHDVYPYLKRLVRSGEVEQIRRLIAAQAPLWMVERINSLERNDKVAEAFPTKDAPQASREERRSVVGFIITAFMLIVCLLGELFRKLGAAIRWVFRKVRAGWQRLFRQE